MRELTYMGVFEPGDDNGYSVYFPDLPGCISCGNDIDEARRMATEAMGLHVYAMEQDGDILPPATLPPFEDMPEGGIVEPVTVFPDIFGAEMMLRTFQEDLFKAVTNRRIEKGLSQIDLAELAAVPLALIVQIEDKSGEPSINDLFRILRPLGLSLAIVPTKNNTTDQSFNVDDIRRIRNEADMRYRDMTPDEISADIHKGAEEAHRIMERIRLKNTRDRIIADDNDG